MIWTRKQKHTWMWVLSKLNQCGLMSSRHLDLHLAIMHDLQSPPADERNHSQYRQFFKHSKLNALLVRDSLQVVIFMASFVVSVVILIGSLFISLSLFLHPCVALVAWWLFQCKHPTWLSHLWSCSVWPCSSLPSSLFVPLTMVRCRGCSRHVISGGKRGHFQPTPQNIIPLATASPSSDHGKPFPHNSFQTTRFKFHSRLNKQILSARIIVILVEEEDRLSLSVSKEKMLELCLIMVTCRLRGTFLMPLSL